VVRRRAREPGRHVTPSDRGVPMSSRDPFSAEAIAGWRREFPILGKTCYLVSHSLGAMPRGVENEMRAFAQTWADRGVRAWSEGWWGMPAEVGDLLAPVFGAPPRTVTIHPNVSTALSIVLSSLPFEGRRNKIVHTSLDFPSVLYVFESFARGHARLREVPSDDGLTIDTARLVQAVDEETELVCVSLVLFKTSALLDVAPVIRRAHEVGAKVCLDAYQAVASVPIDVTALGADFLIGGSVKWLCGGPGAGYLYVRPELRDTLEPWITGWMAHEEPFAFEPHLRRTAGPFRWLGGTPQVPCYYMARPGYSIVREIGVEAIRVRSIALTQRLIAGADANGWGVRTPRDPGRRGGTVTIDVPRSDEVARELIRREVIVDHRPGAGIRVGPHFYNTEKEIDRFIGETRAILAETR